jgi:hypothetical protein
MEEAAENDKELSHSAHGDVMNGWMNDVLSAMVMDLVRSDI